MEEIPSFLRVIALPLESARDPARPLLEAQADELRARFPLTPAADFNSGDFVVHRPGMNTVTDPDHTALCFVRYLGESRVDGMILEDAIKKKPITYYGPNPDCIVAVVSDDGGSTLFLVLSSCTLQLDRRQEVQAR